MKKAISTIALTLALLTGCSAPDTSSHVSEGSSVGVASTIATTTEATTETTQVTVPSTTLDPQVQYGVDFFTSYIAQAPPDVVDTICRLDETLGTEGAVDYLADNVDFATTYEELQGWAIVLNTICD